MTKQTREQRKSKPAKKSRVRRYYPKCLATSKAADDVRAFFLELPGELGKHGQNLNGSGGGIRPEDVGWGSERKIAAAREYKRIEAGMRKVPGRVRAILALAHEDRRREVEIEQHFGELCNLACSWPKTRVRFYGELRSAAKRVFDRTLKDDRLRTLREVLDSIHDGLVAFESIESWLAHKVRQQSKIADTVRHEMEKGVAGAIRKYGRHRVPTKREVQEAKEREKARAEKVKLRRSMAEDFVREGWGS